MISFVAFTAGTYLMDYYIADYEVALSARYAIQKLGLYFIASFVLANLQVGIVFKAMVGVIIVLYLP